MHTNTYIPTHTQAPRERTHAPKVIEYTEDVVHEQTASKPNVATVAGVRKAEQAGPGLFVGKSNVRLMERPVSENMGPVVGMTGAGG